MSQEVHLHYDMSVSGRELSLRVSSSDDFTVEVTLFALIKNLATFCEKNGIDLEWSLEQFRQASLLQERKFAGAMTEKN